MKKINDDSVFINVSKDLLDILAKEKVDCKAILLLANLRFRAGIDWWYDTTIDALARRMGYEPDSHKGKINSKIIEILQYFVGQEWIGTIPELPDVKRKNKCICIILNREIFLPEKNFVVFTQEEYISITYADISGDRGNLASVFLNVKKTMNSDTKFGYPSIDKICEYTGLTNSVVKRSINTLEDLKLLSVHRTGRYIDTKGCVRSANNFYALEDINHALANDMALDYYRSIGVEIESFIPYIINENEITDVPVLIEKSDIDSDKVETNQIEKKVCNENKDFLKVYDEYKKEKERVEKLGRVPELLEIARRRAEGKNPNEVDVFILKTIISESQYRIQEKPKVGQDMTLIDIASIK